MYKYIFIIPLIFLRLTFVAAFDLQSGDVLLMSFNCFECRMIESETNSAFSHSGVAIRNEQQELQIGQSLGSVALYPLDKFLQNRTPGTSVAVYRPKQFLNLSATNREILENNMLTVFHARFEGAPFDTQYLWNNVDKNGRELLYCSEFVAKFLDSFLDTPTIPFPLTYKKNPDFWSKYFRGNIPEGVLGNSPASFSKDARFVFVGNL